MSFLVSCKELPKDAIHTAHFIENFDALFNTFNSCHIKSSQRMGNAFNDSSGHHAFLRDSLSFLNTIKTHDNKELPCIYGWKMSVNALLGLWHYLKMEENFQFILTSRLNQDCIENLFSIICGKGGFRDNPDAQQFKEAFKYVVADKLFVRSGSSNCKIDSDKILLDITSIAMAKYIKQVPSNIEKLPEMDLAMLIKPTMSLPEQNVATYLAGYLVRKIPPNNCNECSEQLILPHLPDAYQELSVYEFVRNKTSQELGCLMYPTRAMVNFVEQLEKSFCAIFEHVIYMPFILVRLCKSVDEECQFQTCTEVKCTDRLKNMIKLYMKVRIHHALKKNNMKIVVDKSTK